MQHIVFSDIGGPEVLKTLPFTLPSPKPDEVQVEISAIGLNRFDALFRRGDYVVPPVLPSVVGADAVGVVTALGGNVRGFTVGERVAILPTTAPVVGTGTYATHANVPASTVIRSIEGTSDLEEAALWMASLQAFNLLNKHSLKQGDFVLVTAGSSPIGMALTQIARDLGAIVIATSRQRARAAQLLDLGADHVVVTGEQDLVAAVSEITGGKGAALACDCVGGALLEKVVLSVAEGGHILSYGAQTSPDIKAARVDIPLLVLDRRSLTFVDLFEMTEVSERFSAAQSYIRDAVARGVLRAVIDRTFSFDQIVEAHRYLELANHVGKVVVTVV